MRTSLGATRLWSGRILRHPSIGAAAASLLLYGLFAYKGHQFGFVTIQGAASWIDVSAELCILAMPYTMLMIAGEFDLSIGSVVGATQILVAIGSYKYHLNVVLVLLLAVLLGLVVGLSNGLLIVKTRLPSFVATIGTNFLVYGASLGLSRTLANSSQVSVYITGVAHKMFASEWHGFNVAILWAFAASVLVIWAMAKTRVGNWVYALGGNVEAARRAGVPTNRIKIGLFVLTSLGAVLVGVIQTIEYNTGNATAGQGFLFQTPIVVVVGGILVSGGYGSPVGVLFGCFTYGIVSLGIFYAGWNPDWASAFLGGLMVIAVIMNDRIRQIALAAGRPRERNTG